MKKALLFLLLAASTMMYADSKTFMVMSDMHVMVTDLWDQKHPEVFYSDPKMVEHSNELFDLAVARVIENAPDFLLVPGDLTYNGEKKNHEYVAKKFAEIEAAGIQVFLIPGNHDISDPGARDYSSGKGVKTANISAIDFAKLYANFGYKDAVMRLDKGVDSLAYMAYFADDIAIIGMNTNVSNIGGHKSAGGFTEGMMTFLGQCTEKALKDGRKNILVMAHHPVMEHVNGQSFIDNNHIANMAEGMIPLATIQEQLTASHVHVVFTGHAHLHTAAHITTSHGDLYDISTGSVSSYPSPMRIGTLDTETGLIELTGTEITKYQEEGYKRDTVLSNGAISTLASKLITNLDLIKEKFDKHPKLKLYFDIEKLSKYSAADIRKLAHDYVSEDLHKALCALSRGDEDVFYYDNEAQDAIDAFNSLLEEVIGVDFPTALLALELSGMDTDFGVDPELLFRSIYENMVKIGDDEVYTADASGNLEIEDQEGAVLDGVSVRDPKSSYTLTVNGEHGKVTGGGTYKAETKVTLKATADEHYHFVKWSDGNTNATREVTVIADATYTAVFAIDQFTIKVAGEHGIVSGAGTYDYGKKVTLKATADEHYHFVKWSDGNTSATREITVTANATYTAVFAIDQFTITVAGEHGTVSGAGTYDYGKKVTLKATADEHYHFVKWSDGNTNATREVTVIADATYTAVFAIDQFTITVAGEHGKVSGAGTYDYGKKVTLTATADDGYEFTKWSDGNTTNPREVEVTKNATYTAVFEKKVETAAETVEQALDQVVKRIENGRLVIYIDGKKVNAVGQEL